MHLFYTPDINSSATTYTLNEEESKHCIKVLRLGNGKRIQLVDGVGGFYTAEIMDDNPKRCSVKITDVKTGVGKKDWSIQMLIAPTKNNDRIEWFVEKATEIGIDRISFINCKNSERIVIKTERAEKVAIAAMKQSLKAYLPLIDEMADFKKVLESLNNSTAKKMIAHCDAFSNNSKKHIKEVYKKTESAIILIGPEGDFTKDEIEYALKNGFEEITLGESRLRTETAAVYACTVVNVLNE